EDLEMRNVADGIANTGIAQGKTPDEVFEIVSTKVKNMYKDKFEASNGKPNIDDAPPTESKSGGAGRKSALKFQPTEEQRRFARTFVASGAFKSEDEYYKQLQELGD